MSSAQDASEQVEALAALVGTAQAEINQLNENIVGDSSSLQSGQLDGKNILKQQMQAARSELGVPAMPVSPPPPPGGPMPVQHVQHPPMQPAVQPIMQQPVQHVQPSYGSELTVVLQKLVSIEQELKGLNDRLDGIEYFDKKVIDSLTKGLNNKVKQVTIKLDDVKRSQ